MKIKIAQIGISRYGHGRQIWDSLKKQTDIFALAGYALPEGEREKFPELMERFEGFREMTVEEILMDPTITAVAVETEEIYLTKYAILAAKAGKHVHMEKPGGILLRDFEALVQVIGQTGKTLHLGYMYRYNPYILDLLERVRRGELGKILSVEAQMNCIHPLELRQWLKTFPGGMMFYLGCHLVDLILLFQGQPQRILPLNRCTDCGASSQDFGMAIFEYADGVSFAKTSAMEVGGYARRQLVVTGTKATVELKPLEMYVPEGHYTEKTEYHGHAWNDMGVHSKTPVFDRYDGMMAAFAAYAAGERENPYTPEYELEVYRTILKACGETV